MTLSDKMIRYRAKYRLTQPELAEKCGLTTQTICAVENGTEPSRLTKAKIELVVDEDGGKDESVDQ